MYKPRYDILPVVFGYKLAVEVAAAPAVADQRVVLATSTPVVPAAGQAAPLPYSL